MLLVTVTEPFFYNTLQCTIPRTLRAEDVKQTNETSSSVRENEKVNLLVKIENFIFPRKCCGETMLYEYRRMDDNPSVTFHIFNPVLLPDREASKRSPFVNTVTIEELHAFLEI